MKTETTTSASELAAQRRSAAQANATRWLAQLEQELLDAGRRADGGLAADRVPSRRDVDTASLGERHRDGAATDVESSGTSGLLGPSAVHATHGRDLSPAPSVTRPGKATQGPMSRISGDPTAISAEQRPGIKDAAQAPGSGTMQCDAAEGRDVHVLSDIASSPGTRASPPSPRYGPPEQAKESPRGAAGSAMSRAHEPYSGQLMHCAETPHGLMVSLRDAALGEAAEAAVVHALFSHLSAAGATLGRLYVNGRRYEAAPAPSANRARPGHIPREE